MHDPVAIEGHDISRLVRYINDPHARITPTRPRIRDPIPPRRL